MPWARRVKPVLCVIKSNFTDTRRFYVQRTPSLYQDNDQKWAAGDPSLSNCRRLDFFARPNLLRLLVQKHPNIYEPSRITFFFLPSLFFFILSFFSLYLPLLFFRNKKSMIFHIFTIFRTLNKYSLVFVFVVEYLFRQVLLCKKGKINFLVSNCILFFISFCFLNQTNDIRFFRRCFNISTNFG